MKYIKNYSKFKSDNFIKEEFLGKFWRNLTGVTKKRVEDVVKLFEEFKSYIETPSIEKTKYYESFNKLDSEIKNKISEEFKKIVDSNKWKNKFIELFKLQVEQFMRKNNSDLFLSYLTSEADFNEIKNMSDIEFKSRINYLKSISARIIQEIETLNVSLANDILLESLQNFSKRQEVIDVKNFSNSISDKLPETKLLKYYYEELGIEPIGSSVFSKNYSSLEEYRRNNLSFKDFAKSFILFQNKNFEPFYYHFQNPEIYEEALGKDYIKKIDFDQKISDLENIKLLKEDLNKVIDWLDDFNEKVDRYKSLAHKLKELQEIFEKEKIVELGLYNINIPRDRKEELTICKNFLNFLNLILEKYGEMTVDDFLKKEDIKFTASTEDYFKGHKIYKVPEGSGKVYHGGKISPTDLNFLFREQGGMYCGKTMIGANNWVGVIPNRQGHNSFRITRRVYELSLKPGTKMIDINPAGLDSGIQGGLLDEKNLYTPKGIEGMAGIVYMVTPDGEIPSDKYFKIYHTQTPKKYIESALASEVVVFDRSSCSNLRIVPFKELLSEYEKQDSDHPNYTQLKEIYPKIRNVVWAFHLANPGLLDVLKEFSNFENQNTLKIRKGWEFSEAPNDQKVDDLVEKCGTISVDFTKFGTLLDYIVKNSFS